MQALGWQFPSCKASMYVCVPTAPCVLFLRSLIPIRQTEWPQVHDSLLPGTEVVVRVHKINDYPKYR
jgi:hypothetical protein